MKLQFKRLGVLLTLIAVTGTFAGCSVPKSDVLAPDVNKIKEYSRYTYATRLTSTKDDSTVEYDTVYTVTKGEENGVKIILVNNHATNGTQLLDSTSKLLAQNQTGKEGKEATPFMPLSVVLTYEDSAKQKTNSYVDAQHYYNDEKSVIKIKQYANENATDLTEKTYNVTTATQYYDSDTLPYVIAALPLEVGYKVNFMMSSSNRDALQSLNLEIIEVKDMTVPAGTFSCYVAVIRPNTAFTNYASYMYFAKDYDNMLVQITQTNTSFLLKNYSFEKEQ